MIPAPASGAGRLIFFPELLLIDAGSLAVQVPERPLLAGVSAFHNTFTFCGNTFEKSLPFMGDGSAGSVNNLYFARQVGYKVYVDNGTGNSYPVIRGAAAVWQYGRHADNFRYPVRDGCYGR